MAIDSHYSINTANNQGALDIYNGAVYLTTYSFDNSTVSLSERPNTDVLSLMVLQVNLESIVAWIRMIDTYLGVTSSPRSPYKEVMDKEASSLTGKYFHMGTKISHIDFDSSSGDVTFKPRPATTMNFTDFKAWYSFLYRLYVDSNRF